MPRKFSFAILLAVPCAITAIPVQAVAPNPVQRVFVSGNGLDSNNQLTPPCTVKTPCKTFAGALPAVAFNGEIVVLDSAAYGSVTIDKSISITAPPGIYAGISVFAGSGVTINTQNISVVLRGLTINSQGGTNGITVDTFSNNARLSVENCVITNFEAINTSSGIFVNAAATVRIVNTHLRDNARGVTLDGGSTAIISGSNILGSTAVGPYGIFVSNGLANTTTTAVVNDTIIAGTGTALNVNGKGIAVQTVDAAANARVSITRSTITNFGIGVSNLTAPGNAVVTIRDSLVTGNSIGLNNIGTGATLNSAGNNTIDNPGGNSGTITPLPPL